MPDGGKLKQYVAMTKIDFTQYTWNNNTNDYNPFHSSVAILEYVQIDRITD